MKKKQQNLMHIFLNAFTLTIFAWLQFLIIMFTQKFLHCNIFISMYVISIICVPCFWWGLLPRIK